MEQMLCEKFVVVVSDSTASPGYVIFVIHILALATADSNYIYYGEKFCF